jgi:uncharacterized integral membrane protein
MCVHIHTLKVIFILAVVSGKLVDDEVGCRRIAGLKREALSIDMTRGCCRSEREQAAS